MSNRIVFPETKQDDQPQPYVEDWSAPEEEYDLIMEEHQLTRRWRRIGESE